jgi:hypothetical protein
MGGAVLSDENPFEPRREGVPLLLTLDARSLGQLSQEDRERAEFLCELCLTPTVDGLWTWDTEPLVAGLPQTELRPLVRDDRGIGLVGEPQGFIGGVAMWSSHERVADEENSALPLVGWTTTRGLLLKLSGLAQASRRRTSTGHHAVANAPQPMPARGGTRNARPRPGGKRRTVTRSWV